MISVKRWGKAALLALMILFLTASSAQGAVAWGDKGEDVRRIQQRLRQYGYLDAAADGVFGQSTYDAVVWFQKKNGLKADGVVGPATAAALGITLSAGAAPASYHESEINTLARLVHGEARGEPYVGKVAVAAECVGVFDMGARKTGAGTDTSGASPTILAAHGTDPHAVAIGLDRASFNQGRNAQFGFKVEEECAPTVVAKGPGAVSFEPGIARREGALHRFVSELASTLRSDMGDNLLAVAIDYIVRRLTPLECERLQGLPDGYTKIPYRGKSAEDCPDTPRYKALGNGWAVNCARWICQRIQNYDMKHTEEN